MKEFKTLPKMQCFKKGGKVKKYEEGGAAEPQPTIWHVYDNKTGNRANKTDYKSLKSASRAVDRLDNEYGSYRYSHKAVEPVKAAPTPAPAPSPKPAGGTGGGGVGYVPGTGNPFNPDSPLNRKKGGTVRRYKK